MPERELRDRTRDAVERDLNRVCEQYDAKRLTVKPGGAIHRIQVRILCPRFKCYSTSNDTLELAFFFQGGPQLPPRSSGSDAPNNILNTLASPRIQYNPVSTILQR